MMWFLTILLFVLWALGVVGEVGVGIHVLLLLAVITLVVAVLRDSERGLRSSCRTCGR